MIEKDYGITRCPITTQNPQANSILERAHQTIGTILHTFQVNNHELEQDDPWIKILAVLFFNAINSPHYYTGNANTVSVRT